LVPEILVDRLEKLERTVVQLVEQNDYLLQEIKRLKKDEMETDDLPRSGFDFYTI